jgi:hypothetical protein
LNVCLRTDLELKPKGTIMTIRNKLLASAIAFAFIGPAYAQDATKPAQPAETVTPPAVTDPNLKPTDGTVGTSGTTGAAETAPNAANQMFYMATGTAAPIHLSQVMGKAVYNSANENIGEIEEILMGQDGKVAAAVIGVGGFLGMGERKVAVAFPALKMVSDEAGAMKIMVTIDRPTLEAAPVYEPGKING